VPSHLTVTLVHDVPRRPLGAGGGETLAQAGSSISGAIEECRRLTESLLPGVDFTRELALTRELAIGDTTLVRDGHELAGFALWHSTPLAAGRPKDELRVLKLVARDLRSFDWILDALPGAALAERVGRIAIRCQTEFIAAYQRLVSRGYRVHWTDLRMLLPGRPPRQARDAIVMSNWEI
jgi:hypothetical protein